MEVSYIVALVGGVLALLSPCAALLLPAFFAYAFSSPGKLLARTGIFYLGLLTTLIPLGVGIAGLGKLLSQRSEEHTSELQSRGHLVCRLLLETKNEIA